MGVVSPLAAISACQMMLEHLGEEKAATKIESAIMKAVSRDIKILTAGKMGYSTSEVGDLVVKYIEEKKEQMAYSKWQMADGKLLMAR